MDPKVFYGPLRKAAERPPDSDTETEIEEAPRKFKRLHRRTDSEREPRKRTKEDEPIDISSRAGQRELVRRASNGDLNFIGRGLELGWQPTPEALVAASRLGHAEVVGMLLAFGSGDVQFNNITPLAVAIQENRTKVVQLLIEANVSLSWRDRLGRSYMELAERAGSSVRKLVADAYQARRENREKRRSSHSSHTSHTSHTSHSEAVDKERRDRLERRGSRPDASSQESKHGQKHVSKQDPKLARSRSGSQVSPQIASHVGSQIKSQDSKPSTNSETRTDSASRNSRPKTEQPAALKPPSQPAPRPEPVSRKTFSLSDYKNLKFNKAKAKEKEKEKAKEKEEAANQSPSVQPVKVTPVHTPEHVETRDKETPKPNEDVKPQESTPYAEKHSLEPQHSEKSREKSSEKPEQPIEKPIEKPSEKPKETIQERAQRSAREVGDAIKTAAHHTSLEVERIEKAVMSSVSSKPAAKDDSDDKGEETSTKPVEARKTRVKFKEPESDSDSRANGLTGQDVSMDTSPDTSLSKSPSAEHSKVDASPSPLTRTISREASHSPRSPTQRGSTPEKIVKRNEERRALEVFMAKRERERKAREAQMLQKLEIEERRRKSEQEDSPVMKTPTMPDEPTFQAEEPSEKKSAPVPVASDIGEQISKLPFILRQLARTGKPQDVGPLFVHRFLNSTVSPHTTFASDPAKYHCLDLQVGALFGVCLHAKYPNLRKTPVSEKNKQQLWEFVMPWVCRAGSSAGEREEEYSKFMGMPLYWIRGDDIASIKGDCDIKYTTVSIALGTPNTPTNYGNFLELSKTLPINLAVRACMRQDIPLWD